VRAERSDAGQAAGRGYPSPRAAASAPRGGAPRGNAGRRAPDPRTPPRAGGRHSGEFRRPTSSVDDRRTGSSPAGRTRTAPASGPQLRGAVAVLGVFLLTLAAAAADSYIGLGLGMITLVALTAGTVVAGLLVRRRDLLSVVVAPPLVFVAVALVNIGLAPSASLNLPTLATLLVRGFPAMGIATGAAVLIALFRLVTRR
jgi:NADH:ubiquinone oxidoreductase subunit K